MKGHIHSGRAGEQEVDSVSGGRGPFIVASARTGNKGRVNSGLDDLDWLAAGG